MAQHNETGKVGEEIAIEHLLKNGYKILRQNYRYHKAEVDIIAKKDDEIVFVEVKTRSADYLVEPECSVDKKKQKLLVSAAEFFLTDNEIEEWSRFDVVSVVLHPEGREIRHLEGAFTAQ
jgi:putative endonuclease